MTAPRFCIGDEVEDSDGYTYMVETVGVDSITARQNSDDPQELFTFLPEQVTVIRRAVEKVADDIADLLNVDPELVMFDHDRISLRLVDARKLEEMARRQPRMRQS